MLFQIEHGFIESLDEQLNRLLMEPKWLNFTVSKITSAENILKCII